MKALVILNPWADKGRARHFASELAAWAAQVGGVDLLVTDAPGHAIELASLHSQNGYKVIAAAGGDGTVHEVANGLFQAGARTPLGIIPIGSGNDCAFGLGLSPDPQTAFQRLLSGQPRAIEVAHVVDDHGRERIMANGMGIGFDAAVTIESLKITRLHGFPMYVLATARTLLYRFGTPQCTITFDEERVCQKMLLLAAGVGPRVGGGFYLTPAAEPDDGLIDSCLVNPVDRLTMVALILRVMKGRHVTSRHIQMRRGRQIHVRADRPLPIHIDGEIFARPEDNVREVTITVQPAALQIMT